VITETLKKSFVQERGFMKSSLVVSTLVFSCFVYGCGGDSPTTPNNNNTTTPTPAPPVPTTIELSTSSVRIVGLNVEQQVSATVKSQTGQAMNGESVTWSSSADAVVTVSSSGLITSVGEGSATVKATSGSITGQLSAEVVIPAIAVTMGDSVASSIIADQEIALPIVVDMSKAEGMDLASLQVTVKWDPGIVGFVEDAAGPFGSLTSNETGVATGTYIMNVFSGTGTKESFNVVVLTFKGVSFGAADVELTVTTAGNELGVTVLDLVTTLGHSITVGS
jgi:hypothetical protein